jgi:hypothetical protein
MLKKYLFPEVKLQKLRAVTPLIEGKLERVHFIDSDKHWRPVSRKLT